MDPFAIIGGLIAAGWVVKKARDLGRSGHAGGGSDDNGSSESIAGLGVGGGTATGVSSDCGSGHGHGGGDCGGHGGGHGGC
jgi:hypothetical protein